MARWLPQMFYFMFAYKQLKALDKPIVFSGFLKYIIWMLVLLFLEVICNLFFIYYASWLGQSVVRDIRIKLFKRHANPFFLEYRLDVQL